MNLTNPIYNDPDKARAHLESLLWPDGPLCPHCGNADPSRITKMKGKSHRKGVYKCNECRKPFSVTVGTVFERSHIPLNKWLLAVHLLSASKKGMSAHQLWRTLGFGSYRTAWFMAHRIRHAMEDTNPSPLGGEGKTVEVDETYFGKMKAAKQKTTLMPGGKWKKTGPGREAKFKVLALVERGGRSIAKPVDSLTTNAIRSIVVANADRKSHLRTDEAKAYVPIGKEFASHEAVNHSDYEWARGTAHTNTIEGYFSIFKRGMRGIYQHCGEAHLHRYLAEFDFRYSNRIALGVGDTARTEKALAGIVGKRLMYRGTGEAADA